MRRFLIILEIILLYVLPVFWFLFGFGPWDFRIVIFEIFVGLVFILAIIRKMNFKEMGFRMDTFFPAIKLLLPGTLLAIIIIVTLFKLEIGTKYFMNQWWKSIYFPYYLLLGAFSQQFGYLGYLLMRIKALFKNPLAIIFANALLFAFLHVLHKSVFVIVETFIFGAYLTWVYLKKPNIFATTIAHIIIGALVIILGFM